MANSISAFMRKKAKEEEIVTVLAPETFVDEKGERITMKVKRLSSTHVNEIYDRYNYERVARDDNGNFIVRNGKVVKENYSDAKGNMDRLIVEALVEPRLNDKDLMDFYDCVDVMEMPDKVFAGKGEYAYVRDIVLQLASTLTGEEADCIISEAKN